MKKWCFTSEKRAQILKIYPIHRAKSAYIHKKRTKLQCHSQHLRFCFQQEAPSTSSSRALGNKLTSESKRAKVLNIMCLYVNSTRRYLYDAAKMRIRIRQCVSRSGPICYHWKLHEVRGATSVYGFIVAVVIFIEVFEIDLPT